MKRVLTAILCVLLLAGCGGSPDSQQQETAPDQPSTGAFSLGLATEWQEYDPSVERVWCVLSYEGEGDPLEFGQPYSLERQTEDGAWEQVPFGENVGWEDILYTLPAGGDWAFPCVLSQFDYDFTDGIYRVVKEVEALPGQAETLPCEAEFTLRTGAAISAERPYGFAPLEDLPGDEALLDADTDLGDAVLFTDAGEENLSAAEVFLGKAALGIPCQLRTVQSYYESWPMVIDVIYENDSFLWRMRTGGEITEKRFSYVVTDGVDVYLSNGADWAGTEGYDSDRAFLLPAGSGETLVDLAEIMTEDRLAASTARYQVWSQDGVWCAQLTETPTEFGVDWRKPGEGYGGRIYNLQDWDGLETAITGLEWREDNTLLLTCETLEGTSRLVFDPEHTTLETA